MVPYLAQDEIVRDLNARFLRPDSYQISGVSPIIFVGSAGVLPRHEDGLPKVEPNAQRGK